ncbi:hypothetical protein K492DRAFT_190703 [Lichtheimia hyalospora FSU 10163]|nr:hypothetical protein K492DRAFT_190703 [Lichtheimia hyalospora FSU 10163]
MPSDTRHTLQREIIDIMASQMDYQSNVTRNTQAFRQEISQLWNQMIERDNRPRRLQVIIMDAILMVSRFIQLLLEHIMHRLRSNHGVLKGDSDAQRATPFILKDAEELLEKIKDFRITGAGGLDYQLELYLSNNGSSNIHHHQQQQQSATPPISEKKKGKQPATSSMAMLEKEQGQQPATSSLSSHISMRQPSNMPTNRQELKEYLKQQLEPLPAEERVMAILELPLKAIDILLSKDDDKHSVISGGSSSSRQSSQSTKSNTPMQVYATCANE